MTRRRAGGWLGACAALGVALALAGGARAESGDAAAGLSKEQVEQIVRDYLMREPEIIYQALEELRRRQVAAEAERQRAAIVDNRDQLMHDEGDPVANPDGNVTVVEFFDYQCGYCRQVVRSVRELLDEDQKLRVVFKEFPILGEASVLAARAALAAQLQGEDRYLPFHLALMGSRDLSQPAIMKLAAEVGLDPERLALDMQDPSVDRQLQANHELAQKLGIEGTPAFVIGQEVVPGAVDKQRLAALVDEVRSSCASATC